MLTKSMALELGKKAKEAGTSIRANCVCPTGAATEMVKS
jgi:NAD(P)-dependent dehydrogenase (short-subunit alcohol dehydrogenase family)